MRILHTSDWHLGRSFHREGMLEHQAAYVDHLLQAVESEAVDLVVVSGDIYDRALPPVDAVRLANETFTRLSRSQARVVVTSGNHDSAQRLGFGAELIDAAGVFIRTRAASVSEPVMLADQHGPVAVYGLPYLDPDHLREPWALPARSHEAALGEAMHRVRSDLAGRPAGTRSVVLAHAFVAGAASGTVTASDSERDISVGGVSIVPTTTFDGVDYVALGHLHGRHTLTETVRYSGSPLAYSFSEASQLKGSWLVELGPDGFGSAEFLEAPVPRPLARIRGNLADLLADPALSAHEAAWLQVTLTDQERPAQAMEALRRRFPHTLVLGFEPSGSAPSAPTSRPAPGRSDLEIASDFLSEMRGRPATPPELALLQDACDSCSHDHDLDRPEVARPDLKRSRAG